MKNQDQTSSNMNILVVKQSKTEKAISKTKFDIEKANTNNRKQRALQQQITNMPNPIKFVEQKNQYQLLKSTVKNWERKIEIAEVAAKKARTVIRQHGGYADGGEMDD